MISGALTCPGTMKRQEHPIQWSGFLDSLLEVKKKCLEIIGFYLTGTHSPPTQNWHNLYL